MGLWIKIDKHKFAKNKQKYVTIDKKTNEWLVTNADRSENKPF